MQESSSKVEPQHLNQQVKLDPKAQRVLDEAKLMRHLRKHSSNHISYGDPIGYQHGDKRIGSGVIRASSAPALRGINERRKSTGARRGLDAADAHRRTLSILDKARRQHQSALTQRYASTVVRSQTDMVKKEMEQQLKLGLQGKILETESMEARLLIQLKEIEKEQRAMEAVKRSLVRAIEDKRAGGMITAKCISMRKRRPESECVHDNVAELLAEEGKRTEECIAMLKDHLEQTKRTINMLAAYHKEVILDLKDKRRALQIDKECLVHGNTSEKEMLSQDAGLPNDKAQLLGPALLLNTDAEVVDDVRLSKHPEDHFKRPGSPGSPKSSSSTLKFPGPSKPAYGITKLEDWRNNTTRLVDEAFTAHSRSREWRSTVLSLLESTEAEQKALFSTVTKSFRAQVDSVQQQIAQLYSKHIHMCAELKRLHTSKHRLEESLKDKNAPLAAARRNLLRRSQRPARELVHDEVNSMLQRQYRELKAVVEALETELNVTIADVEQLSKVEADLAQDSNSKATGLEIDKECLRMRQDHKKASWISMAAA